MTGCMQLSINWSRPIETNGPKLAMPLNWVSSLIKQYWSVVIALCLCVRLHGCEKKGRTNPGLKDSCFRTVSNQMVDLNLKSLANLFAPVLLESN